MYMYVKCVWYVVECECVCVCVCDCRLYLTSTVLESRCQGTRLLSEVLTWLNTHQLPHNDGVCNSELKVVVHDVITDRQS